MSLQPQTQVLYADELRRNPATGEEEPFFKPDWSPDLLLSMNYIGRFWLVEEALLSRTVERAGRQGLTRGDYDLLLRCTEAAAVIGHVPKLLWRSEPLAAQSAIGERQAIADALTRRNVSASVQNGAVPGNDGSVTVAGSIVQFNNANSYGPATAGTQCRRCESHWIPAQLPKRAGMTS